eukprot:6305716-Lingulodinium_polyedra.AAC.1
MHSPHRWQPHTDIPCRLGANHTWEISTGPNGTVMSASAIRQMDAKKHGESCDYVMPPCRCIPIRTFGEILGFRALRGKSQNPRPQEANL